MNSVWDVPLIVMARKFVATACERAIFSDVMARHPDPCESAVGV